MHFSCESENSGISARQPHYPEYSALLESVSREDARRTLSRPRASFSGFDLWQAYELSWLNSKGCPEIAVARIKIPCHTVRMPESKAMKMYLNAFAQTRLKSRAQLQRILTADLTATTGEKVFVTLLNLNQIHIEGLADLPGICLDRLDIKTNCYEVDEALLAHADGTRVQREYVHSHLLRTLCPITGQPDWASLCICYSGRAICHASLLRYIVSYRMTACFHEHAIERIFQDISHCCRPEYLGVYGRFQRRGGIDINPYRFSHRTAWQNIRPARQ